MRSIEPTELSAFLDGELDEARRGEVRAALADCKELQAQFDALAAMDAGWRAAAGGSAFEPQVVLPRPRTRHSLSITVAALVGLIAIRMIPKFSDSLEFGFALHVVALLLLLAWLIRTSPSTPRLSSAWLR